MTADAAPSSDFVALTAHIVSAFVANNSVAVGDLPDLIVSTYAAFSGLGAEAGTAKQDVGPAPAVSLRKSLASREHIISLIDGKPYKSLKRHLSAHGLTLKAYRERYGLPASYPMVAPAFSERRREVAKQLGLGRKPRAAAALAEAPRKPRTKAAKPEPSA
ncbi:MucR family transcriptional regulator [Brevundimonas sp. PAMC22021]|uniref:MucR family transcriptional regulator n=1 Tax=Brevundimonas sp. PAMC22021 TaxID=2861285 RepID=UPI001C62C3BB|nr:MucR family transcriptional regulator [Brevundimonas sp. PAMC22021]QYF87026.1 MucR family transcriptional regulator [Brevundimonas sp. PAMC22021]